MLARLILAAVVVTSACDDTVSGLRPVGGDPPSQAELERFVRRLHLDLTGAAPADSDVADAAAQLAAGNTAEARRALAESLIATEDFARVYVEELENRLFGGETAESRYDFLCALVRDDDPACDACPAPTGGDFCADCSCGYLASMYAEREALFTAADDLAGGDSTSSVERRYALATPLRVFASPEGYADVLFEAVLGHLPQDEERRNAAAMVQGSLLGGPAGILFHRHGGTIDELLDIVFESEVYREALVAAVFERYLGRRPSAPELGHFAGAIDAGDPDARAVILAVVSSREYFEQ